jgi:hypothetical protein
MPLVEFMMHAKRNGGHETPSFIRGSADYYNPNDNTYVGWVSDQRDFYLPETITILDRDTFCTRYLEVHGNRPFTKLVDDEEVEMTKEEVMASAGSEYDRIVEHCRNED